MIIVYTGGTFDLFHSGHVNFLRRCKEIAGESGKVVVSLNTDDFVSRYKGLAPIIDETEREQVLRACRYVDDVVMNVGDEDSKIAILNVGANYVAIGSDWARKNYYAQMDFSQDWLDENNIGLVYIPYTRDISTTEIKARL